MLPECTRQQVQRRITRYWLSTLILVLTPWAAVADPIAVRHREGTVHGFVLTRASEGKAIAAGDVIQTVTDAGVTGKLSLHFFDGSLYEETTVFEQHSVFRLISNHLTQRGPSFPHPMDVQIDATGKVTVRADKGDEKSYQLKIPADAANGLLFTLIKNLPTLDADTTVSLVATSSKPRVVKFRIRPSGTQVFTAGGPELTSAKLEDHSEPQQ